ncbi:MAG: hypothetical protein RL026_726 [Pseudomonadota bacterium]|jgi:uncharacterized protein (TIGR02001 family)
MTQSKILLAGALLAFAGAASAEVSVTAALTSDYDFRGITQTAEDPAFSLSLNYAHDSGFYAGLWGSNVEFGPGDPSIEIDAFAGFSGGDAEESFGYDIGAVYYTYQGLSEANTPEIYAGISKGWFAGKLWYSWDFGGVGDSAYYVETNGTWGLPSDFSLLAHVGYSGGSYWDNANGGGYFDYSVGVSRSFGNFDVALKYVDGSDLPSGPSKVFSTDGKIWASISTTLPWGAE